ncbi:hypothetical protein FAMCQIZV_CDS0041 [Phage C72C1]|nr:hypothetical protein FAMCQIZV_CDS0041 [Phage C72C1]
MSSEGKSIVREDWANTVRENRKIQQEWDRQIADGFVDAPVKENLTGKATKPSLPPKPGGSTLG